jgi:hypothetical protein
MTDEDIKKLEEMFDMTAHKGWAVLMEDLDKRIDAFKEGLATKEATPYQLGLVQGHIKVYRELQHLRQMIEMATKADEEERHDVEAAYV